MPSEAMRQDAFGTVGLEVLISSDGSVRSATIKQSIPVIDEAVLSAVRQWEYQPTVVDGVPTPVIVPVVYHWAGVPIPEKVLSQLTGLGKFESSSILTGSLSNPTSWIVGAERHVFRGPKDTELPVMWERNCNTYVAIEPGASKNFRCEFEAADLSQGWRWEIVAAWGLPPAR